MEQEKLLNPTKFAAQTDLSITHVYALIKAGKIKVVKKEKGLRVVNMIPESEIQKFKNLN